jgi:DNA replication protein DnaC
MQTINNPYKLSSPEAYISLLKYNCEIKKSNRYAHRGKLNITFNDFSQIINYHAQQIFFDRKENTIFKFDSAINETLEYLYLWSSFDNNFPGNLNNGILLHGKKGCGKTAILESFCKAYTDLLKPINNNHEIKKIWCPEFHNLYLKEHYKYYYRCNLFLDDFGKDKQEIQSYGTIISPLVEVLCKRYDFGSLTFATTNFNESDLYDIYKGTLDDRITSIFNIKFMPGESRRPKLIKQYKT